MNALSETKPAPPPGTEALSPRRSRLRRLRLPLLFVLLLGGGLALNWWWQVGRFLERTDNAYVQGDIAVLGPRIEGHVAAIRVADNQRVRAGEALIELDQALWRARLAEAEASLAEAEAAIGTNRQQVEQQQAQIGAAAAQLTVAQQQLDVLQATLRQQEARRDSTAAALSRARIDLENTVIRAPFDGLAGNRAAQLGHFVRPGQQLIAVAPPPERQWVVANFKETQLPRFRPGQPVRLRVDALPGLELAARIDSLAPATGALFSLLPPENATGNFTKVVQRVPVRLTLAVEEAAKLALLRPGLSVLAEVDTRDDPTAPRGMFEAAGASLRGLLGGR